MTRAALKSPLRGGMGWAAVLLAGCHAPSATLRPVCASNDAPAVGLVVSYTSRPYPQLRLRFERPLGELAGKRVEITGPGTRDAHAQWCGTGDDCRPPRSAGVTFGSLARDSSVSVRVDAVLPDGKPMHAEPVAKWKGETLACG